MLQNLGRVFSDLPFQVLYFYNKNFYRSVQKILEDERPDLVYCQLVRSAEYVRHYSGAKVIDYMDAFSYGMGKRIQGSTGIMKWFYKLEQRRMARYEKRIFGDFNGHTIISEQDRLRILPDTNPAVHIVPNGVDTDFFTPVEAGAKLYDICFVGNMGYRPNIDAAEFLCREIVPHLLKVWPELKVLLAGARPHARVRALEGEHVIVSGWMEDIRSAYASSKVFVAPIFTGIGQQNKVLEAMSMEIPCVCTTNVNLPIGSEQGREVFVSDQKDEIIKYIEQLLNDETLRRTVGKQARIFVRNKYSWDKQVGILFDLFSKLVGETQ